MEQEKISYPSNLNSNEDKKRDENKTDGNSTGWFCRVDTIDFSVATVATFVVLLVVVSLINPIMIQMSASNDTYGSMLFGGSTITQTKRCIINDIEVNCSTIPKIAGGDGP